MKNSTAIKSYPVKGEGLRYLPSVLDSNRAEGTGLDFRDIKR